MKKENWKDKISSFFCYFIVFSILGLVIETFFCYITTGILESRKGLIWGPFCPIYGVGAVILILVLDKFKDNLIKLFFLRRYCWWNYRIHIKLYNGEHV